MSALHVDWKKSPYRAMIGTGGIGSGMFIALQGNHTLGREESRPGHFLDHRDYCKLHIIAHYVKVLLGPGFQTILIGKVGEDQVGRALLREMAHTGLDLRFVQVSPQDRTLFAVCFTYPDGTGGNLTQADSACSRVGVEDIARAESEFARHQGHGVALAAPEVPLQARRELLSLATQYRFWRVGSFISAEVMPALEMGLFGMLNLAALNIDEAAQLAGLSPEKNHAEEVIQAAIRRISGDYPRLQLSLTAGPHGSWSWDGMALVHQPAFPTRILGTAGAGDAHLAAMIAGRVAGLDPAQSQQLAGLVAALSITSPHTIAPQVERTALLAFAREQNLQLDQAVWELLQEG